MLVHPPRPVSVSFRAPFPSSSTYLCPLVPANSKLSKSWSDTGTPLTVANSAREQVVFQPDYNTSVTVCVPGSAPLMLQLPSLCVTVQRSPLSTTPLP